MKLAALCLLSVLGLPNLAQAQGTATIRGTITNAATGQPVAGAVVHAISSTAFLEATADASGHYSLGLTPAVAYLVSTLNHSQLVNQASGGTSCPGSGCTSGATLTLAAGETRTIDFALEPGVHLSGRVADAVTRAPLKVQVTLFNAGRVAVIRTTSETGAYSFDNDSGGGLPPGTYFVAAVANGLFDGHVGQAYAGVSCPGRCRLDDATPIRVGPRQAVSGIDLLLAPTGAVAGRVVDASSGAPLAGVEVRIGQGDTFQSPGATSDASGAFRIDNVTPGTYGLYTFLYRRAMLRKYSTTSRAPNAHPTELSAESNFAREHRSRSPLGPSPVRSTSV